MISRYDISEFFNAEATVSKEHWEVLMKLPVKERIRKRKAIADVYLSRERCGMSPEGEDLLKLSFPMNLSDFKEGDRLFLHKENYESGIKCTLNSFGEDGSLMVSVFPLAMPSSLEPYYDAPLILDTDYVDLRENVYNHFLFQLPGNEADSWKDNVLNSRKEPQIENEIDNETELQDTIDNFNLALTDIQKNAILKSMSAKDYYLIQGPPGTGKSFVLSIIILEELLYFNHRVVVIGPNHMAINNTLGAVVRLCPELIGGVVKIGQTYNAPMTEFIIGDERRRILNVQRASSCSIGDETLETSTAPAVVGMTAHSFYTSRGRNLKCDTLIIDEAGQMTIPLALMGMVKARKVILAGDHKQLPPIVVSDKIKEDMRQSVFKRLMTDANCTMLDISYRMCEPICSFVSELFYDGKVRASKKGCGDAVICQDPLYSFDSPVCIKNINGNGEQSSDTEAEFITELIEKYITKYNLPPSEIAVLAPFRAQVANIRRQLRKSNSLDKDQIGQVTVDTVDKMQGQEREVIIYSMTSGDPEYISDMAEFLFNPNKLNVAFSRAKSKLIIVGNIDEIRKVSAVDYPHVQRMLESGMAKMR